MNKNRFLTRNQYLDDSAKRFLSRKNGSRIATASSKKAKCTQFSEIDIEDDAFVLDVLHFFFDERLEPDQLNDELRDIAARALWKATEGSKAMDMVPRPTATPPTFKWLVKQAVQIGFRRAQNKCFYEAVRRTIKLSMRSEYELAKDGVMSLSLTGMTQTTSDRGVAMVEQLEGFHDRPYTDAAGNCRIGYGHFLYRGACNGALPEAFHDGITRAKAESLLRQRLREVERAVSPLVKTQLTQCQFDALVSFVSNIGLEAFKRSALLRLLNEGRIEGAPEEMSRWVYGDGQVMPGLVQRRKLESLLFANCVYPSSESTAAAQAVWSRPFYSTGEHVLAGEKIPDLANHEPYVAQYLTDLLLELGQPDQSGTRVAFTYGELIGMGDLYEDFDQMNGAPYKELERLQTLIRKSRTHYANKLTGNQTGRSPDATDAEWQSATNERYLELALDNFAHFAPSDPSLAPPAGDSQDHEMMWRFYHARALDVVRQNPTDQGWREALAVNAFGDHFLTDAFSAGHLFNKADVAALFNSNLASASGKLTQAGKTFFQDTAKAAFKGDLKKAFSKHETVDTVHLGPIWGYKIFPFHPNINSASRFATFLEKVHEAEPKAIAYGLVAKIIHDRLNKYPGGIAVENGLGNRWQLSGDDTLNQDTLKLMRQAVSRSIYNIVIEAGAVPDNNALFDYVWRYTPRPTQGSDKIIKDLITIFTQPDHPDLIKAAANLLQKKFIIILNEAVKQGKLKPA